MTVPTLRAIVDDGLRSRMQAARRAYLDDRNDECVRLSVDAMIEVLRADPHALDGTRLDPSNFRSGFPALGVTLHERGTTELRAAYDGRSYAQSEAIYYWEYVLEVLVLAQR